MSGRPWYAFYPDDYERDTSYLTLIQHGAYRRLLDIYYKTGVPISPIKADVFRALGAFTKNERNAIVYVLGKFFDRKRDGYHNKRADEEIRKTSELSQKRSVSASKRYCKPDAIAEQMHSNSTHILHSTSTTTEEVQEVPPCIGIPPVESCAPQADAPPPKPPPKSRGTRWPSEAVVPEDWIEKADLKRFAHGLPEIDLRLEAERFSNYWASKAGGDGTKIDWKRTWFNWVLRQQSRGFSGNGRKESSYEQAIRVGAQVIAEFEACDRERDRFEVNGAAHPLRPGGDDGRPIRPMDQRLLPGLSR